MSDDIERQKRQTSAAAADVRAVVDGCTFALVVTFVPTPGSDEFNIEASGDGSGPRGFHDTVGRALVMAAGKFMNEMGAIEAAHFAGFDREAAK